VRRPSTCGRWSIWITAPYEQIHGWVVGGNKEFKHYAYHGYYALDYTLLDRNIGTEDAWNILNNEGYHCQFEGGWKTITDSPIVGRALTACFIPSRPDLEKSIKDKGKKEGRIGNTNSWPIDALSKGDVYVADGFGKIANGTLIGDNLGNSIYARSGNGVVFDASARDLEGLSEIAGFNAFVRDWDPTYLKDEMLIGLNTPIRIGHAVVLPGDLVLARKEGVVFIPAHLAEKAPAPELRAALDGDHVGRDGVTREGAPVQQQDPVSLLG